MKFNKRFVVLLLVLLVGIASVFSEINASVQRELVILSDIENMELNPHTANLSTECQILDGIYEGLFCYDYITLQSENAICEDFKISRDKKTWTFTIAKDAKFSNGDKITANDVKNSWIRLLSTKNASFASLFDVVEGAQNFRLGKCKENAVGIVVKDNETLVVKLINPVEYLPNILCHAAFSIVPEKSGVYSGAFILKEKTNDSILLVKNENYRDAASVALPSIRILLSEDTNENTFKYNNGLIDWAMSSLDFKTLLSQKDVILSPQFGTEFFFFKTDEKPWNNPKLRLALLTAIPWEKLQASSIVKANSLILPLADYPEIYGVPEFDLDEAKKLLKEAGYEKKDLTIKCGIPTTDYYFGLAKILKEAWQALGVNLIIQQTPYSRYLTSIPDWNATLFTYSWIGDFADPMAFLELFRGGSTLNVSKWQDATYDKMLKDASALSDSERFKKLAEAEQYLLDAGMIIPVSHTLAVNILDKDLIGGWYENPLDIHPLKNIYFKEQEKLPNVVLLQDAK